MNCIDSYSEWRKIGTVDATCCTLGADEFTEFRSPPFESLLSYEKAQAYLRSLVERPRERSPPTCPNPTYCIMLELPGIA